MGGGKDDARNGDVPAEPASSAAPAGAADGAVAAARPTRIPLPLLLLLAVAFLVAGASKSFTLAPDLAAYRCYGLAFWRGSRAARAAAIPFCSTYLDGGDFPAHPFAMLPREYGPLAQLVFAPPALAPIAL